MKYDSGFTPVPQDGNTSNRQVIDHLRGEVDAEKKELDERSERFHNITLPLCDTASEANRTAHRYYMQQKGLSETSLFQLRQTQSRIDEIMYRRQQAVRTATGKYSGVGMAHQRDKAGQEAGAEFDAQLAQLQGQLSLNQLDLKTQQGVTAFADQADLASRFDQIHAYNEAISEGFSLSSAYTSLGNKQMRIGYLDLKANNLDISS